MGLQWIAANATVVKGPLRGHRHKLIMYEGVLEYPIAIVPRKVIHMIYKSRFEVS